MEATVPIKTNPNRTWAPAAKITVINANNAEDTTAFNINADHNISQAIRNGEQIVVSGGTPDFKELYDALQKKVDNPEGWIVKAFYDIDAESKTKSRWIEKVLYEFQYPTGDESRSGIVGLPQSPPYYADACNGKLPNLAAFMTPITKSSPDTSK